MTGFEMFMFSSVVLMFAAMFVFGIVCLVRRDDIKAIKNMGNDTPKDVESNNRNIWDRDNNRNFYDSEKHNGNQKKIKWHLGACLSSTFPGIK